MLVLERKGLSGKSVIFAKLADVYPECLVLIQDAPRLEPMACLTVGCHKGAGCIEKITFRLNCLFAAFPTAQAVSLYFRPRSEKAVWATEFWRGYTKDPRVWTYNPWAWEQLKKKVQLFQWDPPQHAAPTCAPPVIAPMGPLVKLPPDPPIVASRPLPRYNR